MVGHNVKMVGHNVKMMGCSGRCVYNKELRWVGMQGHVEPKIRDISNIHKYPWAAAEHFQVQAEGFHVFGGTPTTMDVSIQQVGNFEGTHTDNCIWHGMCLAVEIVDTRGDTGKGKFQCQKKKQTHRPTSRKLVSGSPHVKLRRNQMSG